MPTKPVYPGNSIMVRPDGPLIAKSDTNILVQDGEENVIENSQDIALCRCGGSSNKPFCDGSHKSNGFSAGQTFVDERSEEIAGLHAELVISVKENAMLAIKGPVTIFSRDGKSVTTRGKAALCRCGHSKKKPFCDISHKKCDFKD